MQYIIALLIAIIIYSLQARLFRENWSSDLSVVVAYNKTSARIGEQVTLTETISNAKFLPLPVLNVKFKTAKSFEFENHDNFTVSDYNYRNDVFSILGNQQVIRKLPFTVTERGYFPIPSIHMVVSDLFLHSNYAKAFDNNTALYVYPKLLRDESGIRLTSRILGDIYGKSIFEDPLSFNTIREYTTGDSMRFINWKASAREQDLMVNVPRTTRNLRVCLLANFDTNRMFNIADIRENVISISATLLDTFAQNNIPVSFRCNIKDPLTNEDARSDLGMGVSHLDNLMKILSRINVDEEISDFNAIIENEMTFKDSETILVVVSNYRKDDIMSTISKLQQRSSVVFVCPEYAEYISAEACHIYFWNIGGDRS